MTCTNLPVWLVKFPPLYKTLQMVKLLNAHHSATELQLLRQAAFSGPEEHYNNVSTKAIPPHHHRATLETRRGLRSGKTFPPIKPHMCQKQVGVLAAVCNEKRGDGTSLKHLGRCLQPRDVDPKPLRYLDGNGHVLVIERSSRKTFEVATTRFLKAFWSQGTLEPRQIASTRTRFCDSCRAMSPIHVISFRLALNAPLRPFVVLKPISFIVSLLGYPQRSIGL